MNWNDHWMTTVFPLPTPIECIVGDTIRIKIEYDMLRLWLKADKIDTCNVSAEGNKNEDTDNNENSHNSDYDNNGYDDNDKNFKNKGNSNHYLNEKYIKKDNSSVPACDRLLPSQCTCGWHLLCGSERLQSLNDNRKNKQYEYAMRILVNRLSKLNEINKIEINEVNPSENLRIILDVSDGSLLSMAASIEIRHNEIKKTESIPTSCPPTISLSSSSAPSLVAMNENYPFKVVSLEKKQFSNLFHNQLVNANDVNGIMFIWDGSNWDDINDYFLLENDNSDENNDNKDNDIEKCEILNVDNEKTKKEENVDYSDKLDSNTIKIAALISECFYYQLHSLPVWSALSFQYKRSGVSYFLSAVIYK